MANTVSTRKKRLTIGVAALVTLAGAGVAFAYWTSTGTGTGEAQTGTSTPFTITSVDAVGTIAPGNAGQTVGFTVTNPGPGSQFLTAVSVSLATPDGTGGSVAWVPDGTCAASDYTATISTPPTYGEIAAGGSVINGVATVTLTNTAENQDDCQGQNVPLYFEAS